MKFTRDNTVYNSLLDLASSLQAKVGTYKSPFALGNRVRISVHSY